MGSLAAGDGEFLEDGLDPRTPDGDNVVLDFARAEARAFADLVRTNGGHVLDDDEAGLHLRDLRSGSPFGNPALLTRPVGPSGTMDVIERMQAFYLAREGGPFLVFSPWPTTDWSDHGFVAVGHPPLMLRPPGGHTGAVDGLDIVRVAERRTLEDFERTLVEAYPVPELQPWAAGGLLGPDLLDTPWVPLVGYLGGEAVATAAAYVAPTLTLVELVSTREEYRGRGIGVAVTAAASTADPGRPAMLISSDDGRGVYAGLGFLPLQRYTLWLGLR